MNGERQGWEREATCERDWYGETDSQTGATTEKDARRNTVGMVGNTVCWGGRVSLARIVPGNGPSHPPKGARVYVQPRAHAGISAAVARKPYK